LVLLYSPKPDYPASARRRRIQGVVVLDLTLEVDGTVSAATLVSGSGCEALDRSALDKVREWRYEPRLRETAVRPIFQRVRCVFRLDP
jgi:protein TonB